MPPEVMLRRFTDRQLGLVTRAQAHSRGVSDRQLQRLVRTGRLRRPHPGVYLLPGAARTFEQDALAACLAAGPTAVASHGTAAVLFGLTEPVDDRLEVTVAAGRGPRIDHVVVHRSKLLRPHERGSVGAVPVTTPARTLLDWAGRAPREVLEQGLDEAFRRGLVDPDRLLAYLSAGATANRAGIAELRELALDRSAHGVPESVLETMTLSLVREFHLPEPVRQYPFRFSWGPGRIDFAYPRERVAVEPQGRMPHGDLRRWQRDNDRSIELQAAGWRVLTFTWRDVTTRRLHCATVIGDALGLRPTRWGARR